MRTTETNASWDLGWEAVAVTGIGTGTLRFVDRGWEPCLESLRAPCPFEPPGPRLVDGTYAQEPWPEAGPGAASCNSRLALPRGATPGLGVDGFFTRRVTLHLPLPWNSLVGSTGLAATERACPPAPAGYVPPIGPIYGAPGCETPRPLSDAAITFDPLGVGIVTAKFMLSCSISRPPSDFDPSLGPESAKFKVDATIKVAVVPALDPRFVATSPGSYARAVEDMLEAELAADADGHPSKARKLQLLDPPHLGEGPLHVLIYAPTRTGKGDHALERRENAQIVVARGSVRVGSPRRPLVLRFTPAGLRLLRSPESYILKIRVRFAPERGRPVESSGQVAIQR
jgi:hypothetical protein